MTGRGYREEMGARAGLEGYAITYLARHQQAPGSCRAATQHPWAAFSHQMVTSTRTGVEARQVRHQPQLRASHNSGPQPSARRVPTHQAAPPTGAPNRKHRTTATGPTKRPKPNRLTAQHKVPKANSNPNRHHSALYPMICLSGWQAGSKGRFVPRSCNAQLCTRR